MPDTTRDVPAEYNSNLLLIAAALIPAVFNVAFALISVTIPANVVNPVNDVPLIVILSVVARVNVGLAVVPCAVGQD